MNTIETKNVLIAQRWMDASNKQNIANLLEVTDENIELVGPRGSVTGSHQLEPWIARANLQLETKQVFARLDYVVLEQQGTWYTDTGEIRGQGIVYTCLKIIDDKVVKLARFDEKKDAFALAELTDADEI